MMGRMFARVIRGSNPCPFWSQFLAVGQPLLPLPLALAQWLILPLDLDAAYTEVVQKSRLPLPA